MIPLIKNNLEKIQALCKHHHVKSLYLIGSATRHDETFTKDSDVDFLYRFHKNQIGELEYADNYFDLLFNLKKLLKRNVDLVAEEKLKNPYFIQSVLKNKMKVYET